MPRVDRNDFNDWKGNYITQQLFNFFRLEAELNRRRLASGEIQKESFEQTGEAYSRVLWAAQCYEMLDTIDYSDLFPEEEEREESKDDSTIRI